MANKIRGYLINVEKGTAEEIEFEETLENIRSILNVRLIDVATRKVGDYAIDFVCDDEALLKDEAIPSAVDEKGELMLFGNLLCVSSDGNGNFASLTDEMLAELKARTCAVIKRKESKVCWIVKGVEYFAD